MTLIIWIFCWGLHFTYTSLAYAGHITFDETFVLSILEGFYVRNSQSCEQSYLSVFSIGIVLRSEFKSRSKTKPVSVNIPTSACHESHFFVGNRLSFEVVTLIFFVKVVLFPSTHHKFFIEWSTIQLTCSKHFSSRRIWDRDEE